MAGVTLPANAQTLWQALTSQGATPVQAAAIMGNIQFESGGNPDEQAMDSNGAFSRGLVMWNDLGAGSGVNWSNYITGNTAADISAQVSLIKQQGGFAKAAGADPGSAAQAFAHDFEACAECGYAGSSQLGPRAAEAITVYQVAQTGNWGLGGGLAPLNQPVVPADPSASAAPTTAVTASFLPPVGIAPDLWDAWQAVGGPVQGAEKGWQALTRGVAFLIAPSTWIRVGEVVLGTMMVSAGVAMLAVVLATEHPDLVTSIASLVPGEGQTARFATGLASGARSGSVVRTASSAVRSSAASRPRARPAPAPVRAPALAGAGRTSRQAVSAAAGTARRAAAPDEDDQRAEAAARAGRNNRAYYRREVGTPKRRPTSDLRRRTA